mgnify:CR=1 FL=1
MGSWFSRKKPKRVKLVKHDPRVSHGLSREQRILLHNSKEIQRGERREKHDLYRQQLQQESRRREHERARERARNRNSERIEVIKNTTQQLKESTKALHKQMSKR